MKVPAWMKICYIVGIPFLLLASLYLFPSVSVHATDEDWVVGNDVSNTNEDSSASKDSESNQDDAHSSASSEKTDETEKSENNSVESADASSKVVELYILGPNQVKTNDRLNVQIVLYNDSSNNLTLNSSHIVLRYNSNILSLENVILNKDLFCKYPTDSKNLVIDNKKGVAILTGLSEGTENCPNVELSAQQKKVFAQLTFKAKKVGVANLEFAYNDEISDSYTYVTSEGSPPLMVLKSSAPFTITVYKPISVVPNTGILEPTIIGVGVTVLVLFLSFRLFISYKKSLQNSRTIIYQ